MLPVTKYVPFHEHYSCDFVISNFYFRVGEYFTYMCRVGFGRDLCSLQIRKPINSLLKRFFFF